jgi:alcohol dehydrogenase
MTSYRFNTVPELRVGLGTAREVGEYCAQLGIKRPLLVTDPGLFAVGLVAPVQEAMAARCEHVALFSEVTADPAESVVLDALAVLQAGEADGVVGLGGGSSMDVAKAIAVLAAGTQTLAEAYGVDQVAGGRLPLILIPYDSGDWIRGHTGGGHHHGRNHQGRASARLYCYPISRCSMPN